MKISAADVKALRDLTNAGMMDCKEALLESNGDIKKAKLFLQEKGKILHFMIFGIHLNYLRVWLEIVAEISN